MDAEYLVLTQLLPLLSFHNIFWFLSFCVLVTSTHLRNHHQWSPLILKPDVRTLFCVAAWKSSASSASFAFGNHKFVAQI